MAKKVVKGKKMTSKESIPSSSNTEQNQDDTAATNMASADNNTAEQNEEAASSEANAEQTSEEATHYDQEQLLGQFEGGTYYIGGDAAHDQERAQAHQHQEGHYYRGNNIVPESEYRANHPQQDQSLNNPAAQQPAQGTYIQINTAYCGQGGYSPTDPYVVAYYQQLYAYYQSLINNQAAYPVTIYTGYGICY